MMHWFELQESSRALYQLTIYWRAEQTGSSAQNTHKKLADKVDWFYRRGGGGIGDQWGKHTQVPCGGRSKLESSSKLQ